MIVYGLVLGGLSMPQVQIRASRVYGDDALHPNGALPSPNTSSTKLTLIRIQK